MSQNIEHLVPPNMQTVVNYIVNGDPSATPAVGPLQYGQTLTSSQLSTLNIPTADPALTINTFLSDKTSIINDPNTTGGFNCLMYDNTNGLVNNYLKDPTICSLNAESKCTLSAFMDGSNIGVSAYNEKTFADYNTFIGSTGLQIVKESVSCGDRSNILMWIYKDANSSNINPDAIGVPVNQCPTLSLNTEDLTTSTASISSICKQPQSYALVYDDVTNAGYKCKSLPPAPATTGAAGAAGAGGTTGTSINPFKCNNL
jgi:hypothetical protein